MHTFVDLLELADDVQPDIREFVLQQVQEERKKVVDGGCVTKERCKPRDLVCKGGSHMLRVVLTKVPNKGYNAGDDNFWFQQLRKTFKDDNGLMKTSEKAIRYLGFAQRPRCGLRLHYPSITGRSD